MKTRSVNIVISLELEHCNLQRALVWPTQQTGAKHYVAKAEKSTIVTHP